MTFIRKIKKKSGTYLAEVKSYRKEGKVKQKVIKYLGKEINNQIVRKTSTDNIGVKSVKQSLDILSIHKISEELGLDVSVYNPYLLALVYSHLLENRSINKMEEWMRFTEIPKILKIEPSTYKFYTALSEFTDFDKIESELCSYFVKQEKENVAAVIDVTDTYFEGKTNNIKKKKGKDGKVRRLTQIGLAVSFNHGFPLFHQKYQGNLSNIQIYKDMLIRLKEKNLSSIIIDRGMLSQENLDATLNLNVQLIAGLRKTKTLIQNFISKTDRNKIYNLKGKVDLKNTTVFIKSYNYYKGKIIIVYNPSIEVLKKGLNFNKNIEPKKHTGYSLIYHNTDLDDKLIVKKYYEKEIVERAFKQLKGILKLRPIRVFLQNHIDSHIKICYLAYAILSLMNYKLRKIDVSATEALQSLRYGYKINLFDKSNKFEWDLYVPLEPHQKRILKKLNVMYKNH